MLPLQKTQKHGANSFFGLLVGLLLILPSASFAVRVKDVAKLEGVAPYTVTGFGLVVGLRNSGDGPRTQFTTKGIINMLRNMGIEVPQNRTRVRNVAAVMVTCKIAPFSKTGTKLDVSVSSIGDAKSLEGGTLLLSPLNGPDGKLYAVAQGPVSIGGFNVESREGLSSVRKNHALVGEIPGGAILQKELLTYSLPEDEIKFQLRVPDFTSSLNMSKAINDYFQDKISVALDAATVNIFVPADYQDGIIAFLSTIENIDFNPGTVSRVVLNEKTGTIVAGGNITISPVAVSHGNITIEIQGTRNTRTGIAIAPGAAAATNSQTTRENAAVEEPKSKMTVLPRITNVTELADALNSLGVSPRDIISIFQSIKKSGALHADLVTM